MASAHDSYEKGLARDIDSGSEGKGQSHHVDSKDSPDVAVSLQPTQARREYTSKKENIDNQALEM